ncbi:hypothetical protein JHK82_043592 [Glycine max]|nr:hypothetical protein JHK82_043592 [Glycine max]
MVLQAIFNDAFFSMTGSSSTALFIGSSASTLVAVDSRHHRFPSLFVTISFVAEEDSLNGACPTEEKSDCLEADKLVSRLPDSSEVGISNETGSHMIFVGNLDPNVTDDHLRQVFSQYGELVHVKIPAGIF